MRASWIKIALLFMGLALCLRDPALPPRHPRDPSYLERPTYRLEPFDRRWFDAPEGFALSRTERGPDIALPSEGVYLEQILSIVNRSSERAIQLEVDLPSVLEVHASEGGVLILGDRDTGDEHYLMRVPLGIDREGRRVDFRYRLDGKHLRVEPRHRWQVEKASYPIEIHVGVVPIAWSEALVKAGENCAHCTRDGDVISVQPVGWNWGTEERKRFAVVRVPKLDARARAEIRARTLLVADPATPEEFQRVADERGLFRYAIDYTELATQEELERIRDWEEEGPVLDARGDHSVLRLKRSLSTSVIPETRRLAYHDPATSLFDGLIPHASAATIVTKTIGTAGRDYSTITAWEAGQKGDLIVRNTIEKGEMYDDGPFNDNILIDLSTTDVNHFLWLTVAPTDRHNGTAHDGTNFTGAHLTATTGKVLEEADNFTIVEWIIFHEWGSGSTEKLALDMSQKDSIARYNIFWGGNAPDPTASAIAADRDRVTVYNNIVYNLPGGSNGGEGIQTQSTGGVFKAYNNTVYNCAIGFFSTTTDFLARNNVGLGNTTDYSGAFDAASSHNMDQDGSAPGTLTLSSTPAIFATTSFPENLHLRAGVPAIDSGVDLTSVMSPTDIDFAPRSGTWDRGADEWGATTAVTLVSLEATRTENGVVVSWRTASELDNLGFHVYRAPAAEGPYERLTATLIPGLGSSPVGATYQYVDSSAEGETIYYELEDVETTGRTELHGPVPAVAAEESGEEELDASSSEVSQITFGDPASNTFVVTPIERGVVLELTTNGILAEPQLDGTVRLVVPGLENTDTPLPVKRAWLDAVSGRKVKVVSVKTETVERVGEWTLAWEQAELSASGNGTVRLEKKARRTRRAMRKPRARLIEVAFQGDAKKALVELSPLTWSTRTGEVSVARHMTVRLSFSGRDPHDRYQGRKSHLKRNVAVQLVTTEPGLHEVRHEDVFTRRQSVPARKLQLTRLGEPVPFHIEPVPSRFGPDSRLYFVAEGAHSNPYGNEAVYELGFGRAGIRMEASANTPDGASLEYYWKTLEREEAHLYQPALLEAPDLWLWDAVLSPERKSFPFTVSELANGGGPATLQLWLQGASDFEASPDHHVRVLVNDVFVAESSWDGKSPRRVEGELPPALLHDGTNTLTLDNLGDTGAAYSMVMLDKFAVRYPRRLVAENGALEGSFDASGSAEAAGLSSAHIVDVTGAPRWLGSSSRFRVEAEHRYLVTDTEHPYRPEIRQVDGSRLKRRRSRPDYLVIGPRTFVEAAEPLIGQRRRQGLRARGVALEEIYAEFGFGEPRPEAIRDFVSYVYHEGRGRPLRYVLLLGDGSYDFKGALETGSPNVVPPYIIKTSYLWTASDPSYAAVNGRDAFPDVAIGRLPASTPEELRQMIDKILDYENAGDGLAAPMVFVSDDADDAGDFKAAAEELALSFPSRQTQTIHLDDLGVSQTRRAIIAAFDDGASILSYVGHGGIHLWADENLFDTTSVGSLSAQSRIPVVLTMNCLNGYYHFPYFDSLSESLLKADGRGAVAVIAPSGLSLNGPAHQLHRALLEEIESGWHRRLGDAIFAAEARYAASGAFPELLSIYHLFGDPALVLR